MNYEFSKSIKAKYELDVLAASDALKKYPKGEMGLTPDDVKNSDQFQIDNRNFNVAFKRLRDFNQHFNREFKKEINKERREKFASMTSSV